MQKKLTLFKINGTDEYKVSETDVPNSEPLAQYNDISELYPNFYNANDTYDASNFTTNSVVSSFYAATPTRTVSDIARMNIGAASSLRESGEGNSQYGTRWIHSLKEKRSKKIRSTDALPDGWHEGRKMKFN